MSRWMELVSEIKRRPIEQYLTPTQQVVRDQICELLQFPNWVNLHGPSGSGKTYVAWTIAKAIGATHATVPRKLRDLAPRHECLIIDNAPYHEDDIRRLLATCNLIGASSVIFVTRTPVTMPMYRVELPLPNSDEVEAVLKTYWRFGYYQHDKLSMTPSFWDILLASV